MKLKRIKGILIVALVCAIVFISLAVTQQAYAGSNGQHLRVTTYSFAGLSLTGKDQNGNTQTDYIISWNRYFAESGKWWKGRVYITMEWPVYKKCWVDVPTTQRYDWTYTKCAP